MLAVTPVDCEFSSSVVIVTFVLLGAEVPVIETDTPVVDVWLEETLPPEISVVVDPCALVFG